MFTKPNFCFPYPATPNQGAWCLAVALIGHTDFDQPHPNAALSLEDVFTQVEGLSREWLRKALDQASGFGLITYESANFEDSDFNSMSFFVELGYRGTPVRIEAKPHGRALPQLKQLQAGIAELQQKGKLTPANLTKKMKTITPLTVFKMKKGGWLEDSLHSMLRQTDMQPPINQSE